MQARGFKPGDVRWAALMAPAMDGKSPTSTPALPTATGTVAPTSPVPEHILLGSLKRSLPKRWRFGTSKKGPASEQLGDLGGDNSNSGVSVQVLGLGPKGISLARPPCMGWREKEGIASYRQVFTAHRLTAIARRTRHSLVASC